MYYRSHRPRSASLSVERAGPLSPLARPILVSDQPAFPAHLSDRDARLARPPPGPVSITWPRRRPPPCCEKAPNGGVDGGHAPLGPAEPRGWASLPQYTYPEVGSIPASTSGTTARAAARWVAQRACPGQRPPVTPDWCSLPKIGPSGHCDCGRGTLGRGGLPDPSRSLARATPPTPPAGSTSPGCHVPACAARVWPR